MKLEEAMVIALAKANHGLSTQQLADVINEKQLHLRKDGKPVTSRQIYAVLCRFPDMFVKEGGLIMLMI